MFQLAQTHVLCINKAIHILLMHGFGTLNILILGHYIFTTAEHKPMY